MHGKPNLENLDVADAVESAKKIEAVTGQPMSVPPDEARAAYERRMRMPSGEYAGASAMFWKKHFIDRLPS